MVVSKPTCWNKGMVLLQLGKPTKTFGFGLMLVARSNAPRWLAPDPERV